MSGPCHRILLPLTVPASSLYRWAVTRRNHRFDRGHGVTRLDIPVISVGNITVGGVGKTPMVAWIAAQLLERGHHPLIAMRGYGARADEISDEQAEYAELLPATPVVAQPDRLQGIHAARDEGIAFDCVVLDDGFQHRRIHRDLDLVLIDAARPGIGGRLLPAGWLREPGTNLARADAVIITRSDEHQPDLMETIHRLHGQAPLAWSRHTWKRLSIVAPAGDIRDQAVSWIHGQRVVTMLGIGNPDPIITQLREAGAIIAGRISASDHQRYNQTHIRAMKDRAHDADAIVMTRKDWVKVRHLIDSGDWTIPVVVPDLAIDIWDGQDALLTMLEDTLTAGTCSTPHHERPS